VERLVSSAVRAARKTKLAATDRRQQLVSIAMNQIAVKGFEGLRFQEVAEQAGINNATLYYYFPTKEALIQGVVSRLAGELKLPRARPMAAPASARDELRLEFEGVRELIRTQPKLFVILTELALRALRDPVIKKIGENRDDFWRGRLSGIIERGVAQGVFRTDIDVEGTVTTLMVQIKGIGHHATMAKRKPGEVDRAIAEIAAQVDHWLTCRG
jgi:TetR/AcrR family transcriptional regulator, regulator of cefoperazone and chloramphenicol sensitivity